ncbi:MAG TPA: PKD domain-containing protein [Cyclobacteriaceae bacterium]|nr:PKD domain-containing protein [Cyclobacteriaceae bacterium]
MPKPLQSIRFRFSIVVVILAAVLSANDAVAQCGCKVTVPAGAGFHYLNGAGLLPGDVICLAAGARGGIQFTNVRGSATNPIIIKNCGGQTLLGGSTINNAMLFVGCRYVHITGTGDPGVPLGINIVASAPGTQGIAAVGLSSDFEIDHMEIANIGYAGIMLKSDPSPNCADVSAVRPNYTFYNAKIHDNYVHNTGGEGIYLGDSFYTGTTVFCGSTQYCHEVRGVRIYNNRFEYTGRESIQVGSGTDDVEIYNNSVYNYGQANLPSQNGGIQMGVGTTGRLYNNFIKQGIGPAIAIQGIGGNYVYNNVVVSPGEQAITINTRATPLVSDIVPLGYLGGVYVINNTFVNVGTKGVIEEFINGAPGNVLYNNYIVNSAATWDKTYTYTDWKKGNNVVVPTMAAAMFVNAAVDDYRIQAGAPGHNAGKDVTTFGVIHDFDDKVRPGASIWDVGAFEISGNQKPSVSVGANQNLTLPTTATTIVATASDPDGSIASVLWTKQSGPAATFANETTNTVSLTGLLVGNYVFRFTATDDLGGVEYKDMQVVVTDGTVNQPPVANPGAPKVITLPTNTTVLTGSGTDLDGSVVTYQWIKISALGATLANANTAVLTLTALVQGTHTFRLTVLDDDGASDAKDVTVTVQPLSANTPPTAIAGGDKILTLPTNSVNLIGSGTDPGGSIATYAWIKQSGGTATLGNPALSTLSVSGLAVGNYVFRLTVTDNLGATAFDDVGVVVSAANTAPVADAGPIKTIQLPTSATTITGSGSDPGGSIASYAWIKVSGPVPGVLANASTTTLSLTSLVAGTYVFRLTVTDNLGATGSDETNVVVQAANIPPTANAGPPVTLILPNNSANLVGSGTDIDGSISTYAWVKQSGPAAGIAGASTSTLVLTSLIEGSYTFRLTVTDNSGAQGTSNVNVIVFPNTTNKIPTVEGGNNFTITLPTNSANLTATAADEDGSIASYLWEKVTGPSVTLGGTTTASLALTNLIQGVYLIRITATDNVGATASDEFTITVTNSNQVPLVSAGSNQVIVLPTSSTSITATASDPDGTIVNYTWSLISGPGAPSLTGTTTPTLNASSLVTGVYIFRITVTDNLGATSFDDVNATVQTSTNISPIANAGSPVTIFLPTNTVNLTGSANDADGSIASYLWGQVSGPSATLTNNTSPTLTVASMVAGNYVFRLTVTDNGGATGLDDVSVLVNSASTNQPPVANAGPNIALSLPVNSTNLIGSASDADGTIAAYVWTKVSGPSVTMTNGNTAVLSTTDLLEGIYVFRLTVTDNVGAITSSTAQVTVLPSSVNQTPLVTLGNNVTLTLPNNTLVLGATASDVDGNIASYVWAKQVGPTATLSGETTASLAATDLVAGVYVFRVTVVDNKGSEAFDEIMVTVQPIGTNQPPVVSAGSDKVLFEPTTSTNINGLASDNDGNIASYLWVKIGGPAAALANSSTASLSVSGLVAGQYVFRLTATDDDGATAFDQVSITVFPGTVNQNPVANAGSNKTIVAPSSATSLSGSGFDPDGSIASYAWIQKSGPATTIDNINSPTLLVDGLVPGVFTFQLTVTDDKGATGSDIATVTVVPVGANQTPVADAGFDKVVNLPTTTLDLQGSGVDPDGTVATYGWAKKSGPASVTLAGQTTSKVSLSALVAGTYQFTLTVTDDKGESNSDDVRVTVLSAGVNKNPLVNAGNDTFVRLPATSAAFTGVASDPDGTIASYLWTKQSGPAAVLGPVNGPLLSASGLDLGIYTFRLEVTDNQGSSATDEVTLTVLPAGSNNPPVVLAGASKVLSLPTTATNLSGSASDVDGSIASMEWTQEAGPGGAVLSNTSTATLSLSGMPAGEYLFRLTATDNENASAFSETSVVVQAAHPMPTVFAGNDTTMVLPNNFISLEGIATPGDGYIIADYLWEQIDGPPTELVGEYPEVALTDMLTGVYTFRLTVMDNFGATATDDRVVTVVEGKSNPIGAAIAFTPNGDLVNDIWTIKNTNMVEGCPLSIFNNLGKKVFEAEEYLNDWTGSTTTGQKVLDGDYYFVFQCDNKKTYSGAFRLIR